MALGESLAITSRMLAHRHLSIRIWWEAKILGPLRPSKWPTQAPQSLIVVQTNTTQAQPASNKRGWAAKMPTWFAKKKKLIKCATGARWSMIWRWRRSCWKYSRKQIVRKARTGYNHSSQLLRQLINIKFDYCTKLSSTKCIQLQLKVWHHWEAGVTLTNKLRMLNTR